MTSERALAKVTLSLRVTGVRPDGFHDIEALGVALRDLADDVEVVTEVGETTCTVDPPDSVPADDDNLVVRAAREVATLLPERARGQRIVVRKRIPTSAGLGGGSADAAAVLRRLGEQHGIDDSELHRIATSLGSDVPFCLVNRPSWMRGRGERLEAIGGALPDVHLVVVTPPFGCATAAVYRAWDDLGAPRSTREVAPPPGWEPVVARLVNDLEPAALHVEPRLEAYRDRLAATIGHDVFLCGSGSSYAAWFADAGSAAAAAQRAREDFATARLVCASAVEQ
jgi:4-diphosphocytidyl-2-C-methyl-D-erythritol kinase